MRTIRHLYLDSYTSTCCQWGSPVPDGQLVLYVPTDPGYQQFVEQVVPVTDTERIDAALIQRVKDDKINGTHLQIERPCPKGNADGLPPQPKPGWHTCWILGGANGKIFGNRRTKTVHK